ncbi:von Willebrand factor [Rubripirellula amarantea]|uniref:von Willebrand factor n=1 Tax=Rubripirellula amarantea TaxID=2527999 RepID=A0A5C5WXB2_9BACT|nr:von Willebrand factor type A domain-containing protein [Rubripirellula amarantea]TWT54899.1 von Willebrand factor [Rubripirellula amarantea]
MNNELNNDGIDSELEARIVALVLGEASDFEASQLNQMIEQRPELATFRDEMARVHDLLRGVQRDDAIAGDDWKLPEHRRKQVIATFNGEPCEEVDPRVASDAEVRWSRRKVVAALVTAACLAMVVLGLSFPSVHSAREASRGENQAKGFERAFELDGILSDDEKLDPNSSMTFKIEELRRFDDGRRKEVRATLRSIENETLPAVEIIQQRINQPATDRYQVQDAASEGTMESKLQFQRESGARIVREQAGKSVADIQASRHYDIEPQRIGRIASGAAAGGPLEADANSNGRAPFTPYAAVPVTPEVQKPAVQLMDIADQNGQSGAGIAGQVEAFGFQNQVGGRDFDSDGNVMGPGDAAMFGDIPSAYFGVDINSSDAADKLGEALADNPVSDSIAINGGTEMKLGSQRPILSKRLSISRNETSESRLQRSGNTESDSGSRDFIEAFRHRAASTKDDSRQSLLLEESLTESDSLARWGRELAERVAGEHPEFSIEKANRARGLSAEAAPAGSMLNIAAKDPAKKRTLLREAQESDAGTDAFSTFSLHVSDVSFKLAQASLASGQWPEPSKIRIEEFINAFDYGDPLPGDHPSDHQKVACRVEQASHPFLQQRNMLRIAMRTAAAGRASQTPLRLTLLLDNSGSMERSDRQKTLRRAFAALADQLTPSDQITLISFARIPRLMADKYSGSRAGELVELIDGLPSEGGTNVEAALQLAYEKSQDQFLDKAQNRIVLLTDGAVNLGDADPNRLSEMVTMIRQSGVALDVAGICAEGLNDEILEALSRQGDGRYYLLDSIESVNEGFANQLAGSLRPSAKNVKIQMEFNPKRVGKYKLLGFDKHRLNHEDFRNDQVDAAEMAAAESGVAMYQFEPKPDGEGDVGSVSVRFLDLSSGEMVENRWPIPYQPNAPRPDQASASLRIAIAASLFAAKLSGDPVGESVQLKTLSELVTGLSEQASRSARVGQLVRMLEQAQEISGN